MTLKNVSYVRIEDMDDEQRKALNITETEGLAAIETHNSEYEVKTVVIKGSILDYILEE